MKILFTIFFTCAPLSAMAETSQFQFYTGRDCAGATQVAALPMPQSAASCHAYAAENSLGNTVIISVAAEYGAFHACNNLNQETKFEEVCVRALVPR